MQELRDSKGIKKFFIRDYLFLIIFGAVLVFSLVLVVPFNAVFGQMNQKAIELVVFEAEKGIRAEAEYLIGQARKMDESRVFDRLLANEDSAGLISLSTEEVRKRGIGGILVADETGRVLSRTRSISQRGDFVFHNTFWGREALEKGESYGIEKGVIQPVVIYGAKKMEREGKLSGMIIAVQIPDDDYIKTFVGKYLPEGTKVGFFSKEKGLIGSNFETPEEKRLLEIYFSSGSDFNEKQGAQMKATLNGGEYFVRNIVFEGGHGSFGNMILFIPHNHSREAATPSLLVTLVFIFASFIAFRLGKHTHKAVILVSLIAVGTASVFALSYFFIKTAYDREHISLSKPPYLIYNSTIGIYPDSATINLDFEHIISVDVLTGGESINAIEAVVKYDPTLARVEEIRTSNSFCRQDFFIEREINNKKGEVHVVCGLPTPGFNELRGTVFELVLQPLKPGKLALWFGENTAVLANDGLGTNVLRNTAGASYLIAEGRESGMADASEVFVFSPSHPNATRWYNSQKPLFTWSSLDSYRYSYVFDQSPDTKPRDEVLGFETSASLQAEKDGVYYFHLLSEDGNRSPRVSHYKVKIDSTPPDAPLIKASADDVGVGKVVRLELSSKDELSGLQPTFYVKLKEGSVFFPTGSQLFVAFPEKGEQKITVRAFDRANNHSESSITIRVD